MSNQQGFRSLSTFKKELHRLKSLFATVPLKKSPMDTVLAGKGEPVAILNRNTPAFYCVPADLYETMMEQLEDLELNKIADARANQKRIRVNIDDL